MIKYLILVLITAPCCGIPESAIPVDAPAYCWDALKDVANDLEVSGPNCRWMPNFRSELCWVRNRYWECFGYPSIADCRRLPSQATCLQRLVFVTERQIWLEAVRHERLYLMDWADLALANDRKLAEFWRTAADAQEESNFWCRRRECLYRLRCIVGPEAYYAGAWPAP